MVDIFGGLLSFLLLYKYAALFVIVYSGAVILPLPVNVMLLAVGAFATHGYFNFWLSVAVVVTANTLGDLTDYGLTRMYGPAIIRFFRLEKITFFVRLKEELIADAAPTVFITRFAGSLSPIAALLAGLVRVPFPTFIFYDFLGNFIEPGSALTLGYLAGDYWSNFSNIMSIATAIVAFSIMLFVLGRIYQRITKKYSSR